MEKFFTCWILHTCNHVRQIIASLTPQVDGCECIHWHISIGILIAIYQKEVIHAFTGSVGFKAYLTAHPICTFLCYGFLFQFVSQAYFKFSAI